MKKVSNFQIGKVQSQRCCLAFAWFFANFSLALLVKVLLIKKCIVYVPNFTWIKKFWILGPNLPKKGISGRKQTSRFFACIHGWYLIYWTFPHRSRKIQQYFNLSSPSSRRDNELKHCFYTDESFLNYFEWKNGFAKYFAKCCTLFIYFASHITVIPGNDTFLYLSLVSIRGYLGTTWDNFHMLLFTFPIEIIWSWKISNIKQLLKKEQR